MAVDLNELNKEQQEAVRHDGGPLLIVAGAGTGKTTVITSRIAYLIEQKLAKPEEILALTFTDKAAQEMSDRVDQLLDIGYVDMWISTFHAFCERLLRDRGLDIGLSPNFKLLDQTGSWLLVRQNIGRFKLKYYKPLGNPTKFIHILLDHFSRCKDQAITPADYLKYSKLDNEEKEKIAEVARTYRTYQMLLLENNSLDFGDLLAYALQLFQKRPAILKHYRAKFKYVLVDEFQDTNLIQYQLIKLLSEPKNNLTVCADDDQAIYRWRGASFGNIVQFGQDYPEAKQVVLVKNYRSCQNILDLTYKFIQANNPDRLEFRNKIDKRLVAADDCRATISHLHYGTGEQEVLGIINTIIQIKRDEKDATFGDFAILVRANEYANSVARACERAGLPYQFLALKGLYSKPVILDIISYLKLLDDYTENSAVWRVLKLPMFSIADTDIIKITQHASRLGMPLFEALRQLALINGVTKTGAAGITKLLALYDKQLAGAAQKGISEILLSFLDESGYLLHLVKQEKRADLDYIGQFFNKVKEFEQSCNDPNLHEFVRQMSMELESGEEGKLSFDINQGPDVVRIMTVHAAKGLEFKHVFITNLVDRRFPSSQRSEPIEIPPTLARDIMPEGDAHLQEERRLFYVAMTRARLGLYFTSAIEYNGTQPKKISRFLTELGYDGANPIGGVKTVKIKNHNGNNNQKLALPEHFSFTQLAAFAKCPRQYFYAHIWKLRTPEKAVFAFGKTMHNTLYEFMKETWHKKASQAKLLETFKREWIDYGFHDAKEKEDYRKLGKRSLKSFWAEYRKNAPEVIALNGEPALELGFNLKINGYTLCGKIDRIDNTKKGIEIIDYKTGTVKEKLRPEDKQQLLIYQIAAQEVLGIEPGQLSYLYLENGSRASFIGTDKDVAQQKEKIVEEIEEIKTSDFRAKPGWQCSWCDYKNICEFARK